MNEDKYNGRRWKESAYGICRAPEHSLGSRFLSWMVLQWTFKIFLKFCDIKHKSGPARWPSRKRARLATRVWTRLGTQIQVDIESLLYTAVLWIPPAHWGMSLCVHIHTNNNKYLETTKVGLLESDSQGLVLALHWQSVLSSAQVH